MGDQRLVRGENAASRSRQPWLYIAGVLVLITLVAGVGWYVYSQRNSAPDWDRQAALDLAVPAGDAFQIDTPWVRVNLAPARPGESNTLHFIVVAPEGTPAPAKTSNPRITS